MCNNKYIYRYEQFVVKRTHEDGYVVVNLNAGYDCHSHVKSIQAGKALCKLAAKRKLPKNRDLYFIESLIRLSNNRKYLIELRQLKQSIENDMDAKLPPKAHKEDINTLIEEGISEYYEQRQ